MNKTQSCVKCQVVKRASELMWERNKSYCLFCYNHQKKNKKRYQIKNE